MRRDILSNLTCILFMTYSISKILLRQKSSFMGGFIFSLRTFIDPLSQVAQNNLFPDERQPEAKP